MDDINVQILDLPTYIKGHVNTNSDDSYTIFINAKLSTEMQQQVFFHEMDHIKNNDFQKTDVQAIEAVAHGISENDISPIPAKDYIEEIKRLQKHHKNLKRQIREDEERINYLKENYDMFARAEKQWLYGSDL